MKLTNRALLKLLMEGEDPKRPKFSMGKLARYAGCHKSFISHLLADPPRKTTCTPQLAQRIAEALGVPVNVLFVPSTSSASRQAVAHREVA